MITFVLVTTRRTVRVRACDAPGAQAVFTGKPCTCGDWHRPVVEGHTQPPTLWWAHGECMLGAATPEIRDPEDCHD